MIEVFGGIFWLMVAVEFIILLAFVSKGSGVKAFFSLLIFGALLYFGADINFFEHITQHWRGIIASCIGYAVAGAGLYCLKLYMKGLKVQSQFRAHIKEGRPADWFIAPSYTNVTYGAGTWIAYWPASILIWMLGGLLEEFGEFAKKYMSNVYRIIYDATVGKVNAEIEKAKK